MKVLMITTDFPPRDGGIARLLSNVCYQLAQDNDVFVLACREGDYYAFDSKQPYEVWRAMSLQPSYWRRGFYPLLYAISKVRREMVDVILAAQPVPEGAVTVALQVLLGKPSYIFYYGLDLEFPMSRLRRRLGLWALNRASGIVAISRFSKERVVKFGINEEKVHILLLGTDPVLFRPDVDSSLITERHRLKDKKVLLTVARLKEAKGQDMVIRSLPKVLERFPNTVYIMVGKGDHELHLRRLAMDMGLEDRVIFAGYVPEEELPLYYAACDVFVMASRCIEHTGAVDGFGIVFSEAGACAKPVIGGNQGGVPDAIVDGVTGLLVDPWDSNVISRAIIDILSDPSLARQLGNNGRARVVEACNWSKVAQQLQLILSYPSGWRT